MAKLSGGMQRLPREEWDFSGCPEGREEFCFNYEFARECPWIVAEYRQYAVHHVKTKALGKNGFDQHGNWHFCTNGDSEGGDDWGISLQIPPGFPEKPYLKTAHVPFQFPVPEWAVHGIIDLSPPFAEKGEWLTQGIGEEWLVGGFEIQINWQNPDGAIVQQFREWLKRKRPRAACERRGHSRAREMIADLKALGAYRLLKTMTAPEAQTYSNSFVTAGLYSKLPDWYEAKARAVQVLKQEFRSDRRT